MPKIKLKNTICLFGDSITYGAADTENGGWGERLRSFLDSSSYDARVYNCGICGDNSDGLLYRFKVECESREPDIIFLSIGINDSQFIVSQNSHAVDIEKYSDNFQKIISQAKNQTDKVYILGLTDIDETRTVPVIYNKDKHYYKKNVQEYNAIAEELAVKHNSTFISLSGLLSTDDLFDGVHPTPSGHEKIFNKIKDFIVLNKILEN